MISYSQVPLVPFSPESILAYNIAQTSHNALRGFLLTRLRPKLHSGGSRLDVVGAGWDQMVPERNHLVHTLASLNEIKITREQMTSH